MCAFSSKTRLLRIWSDPRVATESTRFVESGPTNSTVQVVSRTAACDGKTYVPKVRWPRVSPDTPVVVGLRGNLEAGSAMPVMTQEEAEGFGLRCRRRKRKSPLAAIEKLSAMIAKKRAKTHRMKRRTDKMKAQMEQMESECVRILEQNKLAIEENAGIQLSVDYMVLAFLCGGNGGR